jgi:hypothetical protein
MGALTARSAVTPPSLKTQAFDGKTVDWMEKVGDEQYRT